LLNYFLKIYNALKKLIFFIFLLGTLQGFSQANFSRIGVGINGGLSASFSDFSYGASPIIPGFSPVKGLTLNKSQSFGGSLDYYFTPFINAGIEYNSVSLKDGTDRHNRAFISKVTAIEVRGSVAIGEFIDFSYSPVLYNLRNLNASLGVGFISGTNNVADFGSGAFPSRQHANDLGKSKFSGVLSLPLSVGYFVNLYNVYQEPKFVLGINYKTNFTFSDDIDGYNDDPNMFANNSNDVYTTLNFSVKYLFGPKALYYK
jgi:hypothetical protein